MKLARLLSTSTRKAGHTPRLPPPTRDVAAEVPRPRLHETSSAVARENMARIRILTHDHTIAARNTHNNRARLRAPRNRRNARNRVKTTQVAALEAKWQEPRWKGVERPYSAQDVVAMRGTLQGEAPYQDATAQKLFETLDLCAATGGHSRTYGALDPVQAATMAPKLTSIYVSGWQCSSTSSSSNEPGPDFADYPYDTVLTQCGFLQFLNLKLRRRRRRDATSRRCHLHDHQRVYASRE